MPTSRVITWDVTASHGYETAWVELGDRALRARGRAVGTVPWPYWITYELETTDGFVTRRLAVTADDASGTRTLDLRHDLHRALGERRFLMAWVAVPDLDVRPSRQTYTHVAPGRVRFASGDFSSELEVDAEGLVVDYPLPARRATPGRPD
ncbi:putative glycolipid-binding domain-containing protein [Streptomyces sp. NPDC052012]|uniref:putative glycolipid-binding domain-containing protein n=1 Tax=Streptomyces sp. NPDC052012 TaxID=3155051 RepID=UPI00344DF631